jgi:hypothetical protein
VEGYGQCNFYEVEYVNVPEVMYKKQILMTNILKQEVYFLPISKLMLIKHHKASPSVLLSGMVMYRNTGHLVIFQYKNEFSPVFSTGNLCGCNENGIPIENLKENCIRYYPKHLKFSNQDVNNDGLLDITFQGNIYYHCNENGDGLDEAPIRTKSIKFVLITRKTTDFFKWSLSNTNLCDIQMVD